MRCPHCHKNGSRVVDSRPSEDGSFIRRRRECIHCGFRFTTFERYEETPLLVIKKDGTRQEFSRQKILNGIGRSLINYIFIIICIIIVVEFFYFNLF